MKAIQVPQVAIVDNDAVEAQKCLTAITGGGLRAEIVTTVSRFRELARAEDRCLFVMDYLYKGVGEPKSDFEPYLNATGLLAKTKGEHKGKARVVLLSKVISRRDPFAVKDFARLVDHMAKEEWRTDVASCVRRIRSAVISSPAIAREHLPHLNDDGRTKLVERVLAPFADLCCASAKGTVAAVLGRLDQNCSTETVNGIGTWLPAQGAMSLYTVPPRTIVPEDGPTTMIQQLQNSQERFLSTETAGGPRAGVAFFVPDLRPVVEGSAKEIPFEPLDDSRRGFYRWIQEEETVSAQPPRLLLVPAENPEQVAPGMPRHGVLVADLGHPSRDQLIRWITKDVNLARIFAIRTKHEDRDQARERLVDRCLESRYGYLDVMAIKRAVDRTPAPETLDAVMDSIQWSGELAESRPASSVAREPEQQLPTKEGEWKKQVDEWKTRLRPLAREFFTTDKLLVLAELVTYLSIQQHKGPKRSGVPRSKPELRPWPLKSKAPLGPFKPAQPASAAWVDVLFEEIGLYPADHKYSDLGEAIVGRLRGQGRGSKELAKKVANRLREFHQGTVPETEKRSRRSASAKPPKRRKATK